MGRPVDGSTTPWLTALPRKYTCVSTSMAVSRPGDNQYRAVPGTRLFDRIQLRSCDTEAQGQLLNQQRREVGGIIA